MCSSVIQQTHSLTEHFPLSIISAAFVLFNITRFWLLLKYISFNKYQLFQPTSQNDQSCLMFPQSPLSNSLSGYLYTFLQIRNCCFRWTNCYDEARTGSWTWHTGAHMFLQRKVTIWLKRSQDPSWPHLQVRGDTSGSSWYENRLLNLARRWPKMKRHMFVYYITLARTFPVDIYFIRPTTVGIIVVTAGILLRSKMFYSVLYFSTALLTNLEYKITGFWDNNNTV